MDDASASSTNPSSTKSPSSDNRICAVNPERTNFPRANGIFQQKHKSIFKSTSLSIKFKKNKHTNKPRQCRGLFVSYRSSLSEEDSYLLDGGADYAAAGVADEVYDFVAYV